MCCRVESDKQRAELQQQHEADQRATVDQLTSLKVSEMDAVKQGWQSKVNDLLHEVMSVNCSMNSLQSLLCLCNFM